jgi:hypothetical protein
MKKKVSKKKTPKKQTRQFPKIYLIITEELKFFRRKFKIIAFGFVFGVIFALLLISAIDLVANVGKKNSLDTQRKHLQSQVAYWQNFVNKQKGYRDGYFMLAVLNYQLKDFEKAGEYLAKTLSIDSGFSPAKDFQEILDKQVR